ncbi:MAG: hypothetical protein WAR79_05370 [Melioribacteraceae bacterium]
MKKIIFALSIFVFISCNSDSPTITETGYGKLFVQSNVEKGEIFIDNEFSGKFTQDTLELFAVKYLIKVRKENYFSEEKEVSIKKNFLKTEEFILRENNLTKNILIETFANSFCDSCENSNLFSNILLVNPERIFIVNYPTDYPNINDVFYFDFYESVTNRIDYYNILNFPSLIVDGIISSEFEEVIENEINKKTNFEILVHDSLVDGNGITADIFVDVYDLDGNDFNSLMLRNALIEKEINTTVSDRKVHYILRKFIPNYEGISLSSITKKGRSKFAEFTLVDPRWEKENLYVISFIQNELTKEVMQVGVSK